MRILILGATGMLGHVLFRELRKEGYDVYGTVRSLDGLDQFFSPEELARIRPGVDAADLDTVIRALAAIEPDLIVNCIGIVKQLPIARDPLISITINAQLPHRLSMISKASKCRLVQISTDCVFNGNRGNYTEADSSNAEDLYGRTKYLGEVSYPHCITLRTSIIGHEIKGSRSLLDWFLSQSGSVNGFAGVIYSGMTTLEMVNILKSHIFPNPALSGVYHISSDAISKFELLQLCRTAYQHDIEIHREEETKLDRSLDSSRFRADTGYRPPSWPATINQLANYYQASGYRMGSMLR